MIGHVLVPVLRPAALGLWRGGGGADSRVCPPRKWWSQASACFCNQQRELGRGMGELSRPAGVHGLAGSTATAS